MMVKLKIIYMLLLIGILSLSCKESYISPVSVADASILVVEGVFNPAGTTSILLSRTQHLNESAAAKPELKAQVTIESDAAASYTLKEEGSGRYTLSKTVVSATAKYRLRIKTSNGKEYLSEFVNIITSPAIDQVGWKNENGGVRIVVSTHDPANNTRYYRWEAEETWEFRANLYASLVAAQILAPGGFRYVLQDISFHSTYPFKNICWKTEKSNSIWLASTTQLSADVVNESPLGYIPKDSWQLGVKYSILVRQYAQSKQGFSYWQNMKKNSEELGSLFSPQPSETSGNIFATGNLQEPVIGFFEACVVSEKRIFINASDVPQWNYNPQCLEEKMIVTPANIQNFYFGYNSPLSYTDLNKKDSVITVPNYCVDCSVRGSSVKPSFWP